MLLWIRLHRWRETGMGIGRFSWRDFEAFQNVTGEELSLGDLDGIGVIEDEFMASREAADKARRGDEERIAASKARTQARRR
jgi:hypothetical protein